MSSAPGRYRCRYWSNCCGSLAHVSGPQSTAKLRSVLPSRRNHTWRLAMCTRGNPSTLSEQVLPTGAEPFIKEMSAIG